VQLHERGCHAAQLAVISQDLWFSQMKSTHLVDYVALDLDPMPSVPFEQVVQVALQCRDVVETLKIPHGLKHRGLGTTCVYPHAFQHNV
jgi:DNA primase